MSFEDIPGQLELKDSIISQLESDRWPHTSLIYGNSGLPSLTFALSIAHQLLIQGARDDQRNETLSKAIKLIHPDLHLSFPVQGAKTTSDDALSECRSLILENQYLSLSDWASHHASEKGQVNISVAECTNIFKKLSLKPFEGGRKVLVIWGAEYLGKEGNRLLKLLEEPPEKTFIILVSEDMNKILPTILSRCQVYALLPPSESEILPFLQQRFSKSDDVLKEAISLGDGNFSRIVKLLQEKTENLTFNVGQWIEMVSRGQFESMLQFSQEFSKWPKEQQKLIFTSALSKLRRMLTMKEKDDVIFVRLLGDPIDPEIVDDLTGCFSSIIFGLERNAHVPSLIMSESIRMWKKLKERKSPST